MYSYTCICFLSFFFFFSSRRRHTRWPRDWSSDVCSSDLVAETLFGILLIAGFKIRMASVLSGLLLLSFAMGMVTGLGIKTPFDYSVFSAAAAAFLLAFWEPDRFTLDKLLNRSRN